MTIGYNDKLSPEDQIDTEEEISMLIYEEGMGEYQSLSMEDSNKLSKEVLLLVLRKFRSDLVDES